MLLREKFAKLRVPKLGARALTHSWIASEIPEDLARLLLEPRIHPPLESEVSAMLR